MGSSGMLLAANPEGIDGFTLNRAFANQEPAGQKISDYQPNNFPF
jgi:hypothetical protein